MHLPDVDAARIAYLGLDDATDVQELDQAELLARAEAGDVVVLDVRPVEEYAAGHIPGALSIPVEQLPERLPELPRDTEIVAYCRGAYCVMAHEATRLLGRAARCAAHRRGAGVAPVRPALHAGVA